MNPMTLFQHEAPDVARAFDGLIQSLRSLTDGLDNRTRQLVYVAMKASQGDLAAVHAHVPMALAEGATRGQIRDAILMTLTVSGIKGVASCLGPALEICDARGVV